MKETISVVVPVYNVEKYLDKCVISILQQTYDQLEIILVNDGSTDSSLAICKKYATDARVKIVDKENGGLSSARNAGFEIATGSYVIFVDSDDYLSSDAITTLYKECKEHDLEIVSGIASTEYEDGTKGDDWKSDPIIYDKVLSGKEIIRDTNYDHVLPMIWLNMYQVSFLRKNGLLFKNGIYHEDSEFTPRALYLAKRVKYIDYIHYHQLLSKNSIMRSKNIKKCYHLIEVADSLDTFINNTVIEEDIAKILKRYTDYLYKASVDSALQQGIPVKELFQDSILKQKIMSRLSKSKKYRVYALLIRLHLIQIVKH